MPASVGKRVLRNEDARLLTGRALFVDDVQVPGMLHAAFLRSDDAHGRLGSIDVSAARTRPGVVAVFTAGDLGAYWKPAPLLVPPPPVPGMTFHVCTQVPLARDKVRHVGDPIAAVVAETLGQARDAAEAIEVDIEELPAVVDMRAALEPGAPLVHEEAGTNLCFDWSFIEDSRDPEPTEGAGTMGLEWLHFPERLDALLVPLGNGAMLAGIATVIKARLPGIRVIAVSAAGAPAMVESLRAGRLVSHERIDTIADGIAARVPVPEALALLEGLYDAIVAVTEDQIVNGMRLAHQHLGLVIEPAGAVGLAAIAADAQRFAGKRLATILTGSNISDTMRRQLIG